MLAHPDNEFRGPAADTRERDGPKTEHERNTRLSRSAPACPAKLALYRAFV
jgi:hypothetical protein